jgi:hypothetical protein
MFERTMHQGTDHAEVAPHGFLGSNFLEFRRRKLVCFLHAERGIILPDLDHDSFQHLQRQRRR